MQRSVDYITFSDLVDEDADGPVDDERVLDDDELDAVIEDFEEYESDLESDSENDEGSNTPDDDGNKRSQHQGSGQKPTPRRFTKTERLVGTCTCKCTCGGKEPEAPDAEAIEVDTEYLRLLPGPTRLAIIEESNIYRSRMKQLAGEHNLDLNELLSAARFFRPIITEEELKGGKKRAWGAWSIWLREDCFPTYLPRPTKSQLPKTMKRAGEIYRKLPRKKKQELKERARKKNTDAPEISYSQAKSRMRKDFIKRCRNSVSTSYIL